MADLRIASETARFTLSSVNVGIVPGDGGCYYLPRIIGVARALDLIWTGRTMDTKEAVQIGYVSRVGPTDQLMDTVTTFAKRLASGPQVAIELAKRLVGTSPFNRGDMAGPLKNGGSLGHPAGRV